MVYIHYGAKSYDPDKVKPIENIPYFSKPNGGFWASPIDAQWGWIDWCRAEDFRYYEDNEFFKFTLKDNAKVLHIYSIKDLEDLPKINQEEQFSLNSVYLDFEKLKETYDAIELHLSEERDILEDFWNRLYYKLYGWDCDSILIMNPHVVIVVE